MGPISDSERGVRIHRDPGVAPRARGGGRGAFGTPNVSVPAGDWARIPAHNGPASRILEPNVSSHTDRFTLARRPPKVAHMQGQRSCLGRTRWADPTGRASRLGPRSRSSPIPPSAHCRLGPGTDRMSWLADSPKTSDSRLPASSRSGLAAQGLGAPVPAEPPAFSTPRRAMQRSAEPWRPHRPVIPDRFPVPTGGSCHRRPGSAGDLQPRLQALGGPPLVALLPCRPVSARTPESRAENFSGALSLREGSPMMSVSVPLSFPGVEIVRGGRTVDLVSGTDQQGSAAGITT